MAAGVPAAQPGEVDAEDAAEVDEGKAESRPDVAMSAVEIAAVSLRLHLL
jgi:hypothetical protein